VWRGHPLPTPYPLGAFGFVSPSPNWNPGCAAGDNTLAVERRLVVDFCGQYSTCMWSYYPPAWILSALPLTVTIQNRSRSGHADVHFTNGFCHIRERECGVKQSVNNIIDRRSAQSRRSTAHCWHWTWRSRLGEETSPITACTREMKHTHGDMM